MTRPDEPTLTYGHGYLVDCTEADHTVYNNETRNNMTDAQTSLTCEYNDVFKLKGYTDTVDNEWVKYLGNITDFSADDYPYWVLRYRTNEASDGLGLVAKVEYDDASLETLVGATAPQFSIDWTVVSGTLKNGSGKDVSKISFRADDHPDSTATTTTDTVEIDFLLFCKGVFTFPSINTLSSGGSAGVKVDLPSRNAFLEPPGRMGDITQGLGAKNAQVRIWGEMSDAAGWKGAQNVPGEVFYELSHGLSSEPWQWFTSDLGSFKVSLDRVSLEQSAQAIRTYELLLKEYRRSCASNEEPYERYGLNL